MKTFPIKVVLIQSVDLKCYKCYINLQWLYESTCALFRKHLRNSVKLITKESSRVHFSNNYGLPKTQKPPWRDISHVTVTAHHVILVFCPACRIKGRHLWNLVMLCFSATTIYLRKKKSYHQTSMQTNLKSRYMYLFDTQVSLLHYLILMKF